MSVELDAGPNWEQFQSAQVPSHLAPRSVELDGGPNWEQFRSAQVPSHLAPRSVELDGGPIGSSWINWLRAGLVYNKKRDYFYVFIIFILYFNCTYICF